MTSLLSQAAESVLTVCEDALIDAGYDLPARSYVSFGAPTLDCDPCDTLAVHVERTAPTTDFPREATGGRLKCSYRTVVTFVVTIAECWPVARDATGAPAAPDVLQDHAGALYDMWWHLWAALLRASAQRTLAGGAPTSLAAGGAGTPNGPSGGCAHATIRVLVELTNTPTGS